MAGLAVMNRWLLCTQRLNLAGRDKRGRMSQVRRDIRVWGFPTWYEMTSAPMKVEKLG